MSGARSVLLAVCFTAFVPPAAFGQIFKGGDAPRRRTVELSGGGMWAQGFDLGSRQAQLTRGTGSEAFALFASDSDVGAFAGAQVHLGVFITRLLSVEGGVRFARPTLSIRLSADSESAAGQTATERLSHYLFEGSVLVHFSRRAFARGRAVPFISGGIGHIRELHEANELVETGREFHGTAGVKYWWGRGRRRAGLRGEIGVSSRERGLDAGGERRVLPIATGGLSLLF